MAELLSEQLDLLDRQLDGLAAAHAKASGCLDLEDALSMCVSLMDAIERHAARVCGEGASRRDPLGRPPMGYDVETTPHTSAER